MSIKTTQAPNSLATGPFSGNNVGQQARHGTPSGAVTHYRYRQPLCEPCKLAARDYGRAQDLRCKSGYALSLDEAYAELGLPADRTDLASAS